jgi:hypothetical protein
MLNPDQRICLKSKLKNRMPYLNMGGLTDEDLMAKWVCWFGYLPMSRFNEVKEIKR